MIELRLRSRSRSRSNGSYSQLPTEDELDDSPITPLMKKPMPYKKALPAPQSHFCAQCCVFFSLSGIVFLCSIAYLLHIDSPYIKLSPANAHRKPALVEGLLGAVVMYGVCGLVAGGVWIKRARSVARPIEEARLVD